jgi:hypothetical protein
MIKQLLWCLALFAGVVAIGAGITAAHAATCSGTLAPGTYDSLNVLPGDPCIVSSGTVTVTGNFTVGAGASLVVISPAKFTVNSSLSAVGASKIVITPAPMGAANFLGSVFVIATHGATVDIEDSIVGGTLSVSNSTVAEAVLRDNNVAGNVLFRNNGAPVDTNTIAGNTIGGSLVCTGNTPLPVDAGSPNTVGGAKVGQCSGL